MGHENYKHVQGIPKGTIEIYGRELEDREFVIGVLKGVYRSFGFDPLTTPILEFAEVFNGHHGEGEELLFHLRDRSSDSLVLRYDLTVPLARYMADHPEAPIPFKRFQVDNVFRDDEVDKGHFRQFIQCDADIVGIHSLIADSEVISMAHEGLRRLNFPEFVIKVNHRQIINAVAEKAGLFDREGQLLIQRTLDEISKFSEKWAHHGKPHYQSSYLDRISEIVKKRGLNEKGNETIQSIFSISGDFDQKLSELKRIIGDVREGEIGISELEEIVSYLEPSVKDKIDLDLSLARGADYYTGFILEGSLPNVPIGAVLGGGRFDNLVKALGGPDLPAVGMAFGLDRIMVALADLKLLRSFDKIKRVMVFSESGENDSKLLQFVKQLRSSGIYVDFIPAGILDASEIVEYAKKRNFDSLASFTPDGIKLVEVNGDGVIAGLPLIF